MSDRDQGEMRRMDDRLIGELTAKVEILMTQVGTLQGQVTDLNNKISTGRGMLIGMLTLAGTLGAGLSEIVQRILK